MKLADIAKAAEKKFGPVTIPVEDDNGKVLVEFSKMLRLSDEQKAAVDKVDEDRREAAKAPDYVESNFTSSDQQRKYLVAVSNNKTEARKLVKDMDDATVLFLMSQVTGDDDDEDEQGK